jgi:hypothetical protein
VKRVFGLIAAALTVVLLVLAGYVAYVFIDYYRLPDMQALEVAGTGESAVVGQTYTALSYNIGFGAYSVDFGFFMDGGEHARGRSREEVEGNVSGAYSLAESLEADLMLF